MIHLSSGKFATAAVVALLVGSQAAHAADSFDLTVTGVIQPAACEATIAGGGNFDYGLIPTQKLKADSNTVLEVLSTSISIVCEAPTRVAFRTVDNRQGTAAAAANNKIVLLNLNVYKTEAFGLGIDSDGNKIGMWLSNIDNVTTDALTSVSSISTRQISANEWSMESWPGTGFGMLPDLVSSIAAPGETTPTAFTTLSGTLNIQAAIAPSSTLNLSEPVNLDGSVTVEMSYL